MCTETPNTLKYIENICKSQLQLPTLSEFIHKWETKFHWNIVSHEFYEKLNSTEFV